MEQQEDRPLTNADQNIINQPDSVGEEELPSGIEKTDKQTWNYIGNKTKKDTWWKKITDWGTKDWGYK